MPDSLHSRSHLYHAIKTLKKKKTVFCVVSLGRLLSRTLVTIRHVSLIFDFLTMPKNSITSEERSIELLSFNHQTDRWHLMQHSCRWMTLKSSLSKDTTALQLKTGLQCQLNRPERESSSLGSYFAGLPAESPYTALVFLGIKLVEAWLPQPPPDCSRDALSKMQLNIGKLNCGTHPAVKCPLCSSSCLNKLT